MYNEIKTYNVLHIYYAQHAQHAEFYEEIQWPQWYSINSIVINKCDHATKL